MGSCMLPGLSTPHFESNDYLTPSLSPALSRRVKRHVTGVEQVFFVITAPGIEAVCAQELAALGIDTARMHVSSGGIEFSGRLRDAYRVHLHSRLSIRVLMRIRQFTATNFATLENKVLGVPWELFICPGCGVKLKVSAQQSRLIHSRAIAERVERGLMARLGQERGQAHAVLSQTLFVRVVRDRFTLSLDATGEPLYRRGLKTHGGRAPLRETSAAAMLRLSGYRPDRPLIDPMCGTGTFALEAALLARNIAPGWFRTFAFMGWPSFAARQWAHLRREAQSRFSDGKRIPIVASDIDPDACRRLAECLAAHDLSETVQVLNGDFFDMTPASVLSKRAQNTPGLIVINPPYGRRLGTERHGAARFGAIGNKLKADFKGWRFGLLAPAAFVDNRFPIPFTIRPFHHGGIKAAFLTGEIR
jgi:putative N6-adenine-specific DNA methylase